MSGLDYNELIRSHYKRVAEDDGASGCSTMKDEYIREAETSLISGFIGRAIDQLSDNITVADIGCGNGYTLFRLVEEFPEVKFVGYEYTPELYEIATERFRNHGNVDIILADVREKFCGQDAYDICYTQRVIINLLDKDDQKKAISNIIDGAVNNGFILFLESFQQGLFQLNEARKEFSLSEIEGAYHNLLLDENFFQWTADLQTLESVETNFLSSYFYIARVLHPLLLGDLSFKRNSHFVKYMSSSIEKNYGCYSPIQAFGFRK